MPLAIALATAASVLATGAGSYVGPIRRGDATWPDIWISGGNWMLVSLERMFEENE